jgi:hypothetical protein
MSIAERIKSISIAAMAVLSLFASSVSACTCSHHVEQAKAESPSCHSHTHRESSTPTNASPTSVDSLCECLLAKPAPAIIAKSEKKKLQLQKEIAETKVEPMEVGKPIPISVNPVSLVLNDPSIYLTRHFACLLPARAPPRL